MADKTFVVMGATSHSKGEREKHDYYATDPVAVEELLKVETFNNYVWECAYGEGHIGNVLENNGYKVYKTDIVKRSKPLDKLLNFLTFENKKLRKVDIITNPLYKYAKEFVEKSLDIIENGCKVAMLLKLTFLESKSRRELFETNPPKYIYVFSKRITCAINGEFDKISSSAIAYAWFVWVKGYKGNTIIKWIN